MTLSKVKAVDNPQEMLDDYKAAVLNVKRSVSIIESRLEIQKDEEHGLKVIGAVYRIEDGTVEFGVFPAAGTVNVRRG